MLEESTDAGAAAGTPGTRIDWRTGKTMVQRDDAFWHEHERRRLELGTSVPQYCASNGLALSTYRHRVHGRKRASRQAEAPPSPTSSRPAFVAVTSPRTDAAATIEIELEGMTMRLCGAVAERVLDRVMERLA